ncbi:hypothetical protein [Methylocapsa aurea]|uniref:hypothetical protein n=1 Tax=Methylocapsa aurea TaxID=663610 RepID=UPI001FD8EA21|nr:hypothetical protein [Methylocapsa aurea]
MAIHDRDKTGKTRVRCSAFRESRSCSHARLYYLEDIERVTVEGLRAELRDPRMIAEFAKIYHAERSKLAHEAVVARANTERRRNETTRSLKRLVDALADESANIGAIRNRLLDLEGERARIEAELADMPEPIDATALHPMAIARYLEQIDQLSAALKSGRDIMAGSSADSFRALVNAVIVHPVAPRTPLDIELRGYLAELTAEPKFRPHGRHSGVTVVAEARYSHSPPPEIAEFPLRLQGAFVRPNAI